MGGCWVGVACLPACLLDSQCYCSHGGNELVWLANPAHPPSRCRWVVPLLWLPLAALLAWRALAPGALPLATVAALAAAGVVLWQLIEYSLHRWLFHTVPSSPHAILLHFLMHG